MSQLAARRSSRTPLPPLLLDPSACAKSKPRLAAKATVTSRAAIEVTVTPVAPVAFPDAELAFTPPTRAEAECTVPAACTFESTFLKFCKPRAVTAPYAITITAPLSDHPPSHDDHVARVTREPSIGA